MKTTMRGRGVTQIHSKIHNAQGNKKELIGRDRMGQQVLAIRQRQWGESFETGDSMNVDDEGA